MYKNILIRKIYKGVVVTNMKMTSMNLPYDDAAFREMVDYLKTEGEVLSSPDPDSTELPAYLFGCGSVEVEVRSLGQGRLFVGFKNGEYPEKTRKIKDDLMEINKRSSGGVETKVSSDLLGQPLVT